MTESVQYHVLYSPRFMHLGRSYFANKYLDCYLTLTMSVIKLCKSNVISTENELKNMCK